MFSEGINEGVPEIFAPFCRNIVEFSGVIVVFVGSTATAEATALIASEVIKIAPRIRNSLLIILRRIYCL
jgi:hypothetical protein